MIFRRNGIDYRIVIGLEGGCYLTRWYDELEQRHGTPHWRVVLGVASAALDLEL